MLAICLFMEVPLDSGRVSPGPCAPEAKLVTAAMVLEDTPFRAVEKPDRRVSSNWRRGITIPAKVGRTGRRAMGRSKVYTRTGDDGSTALIGARRVSKADQRIEAYGTVDELNCFLGLVRASLEPPPAGELAEVLGAVQHDLFSIGAVLANPNPDERYATAITPDQVSRLEQWIDHFDSSLEPLRAFILPGGSRCGALLHVARAVCRRAERRVVALASQANVPAPVVAYLNRLGDLLFVLARYVNALAGAPEEPWPGL